MTVEFPAPEWFEDADNWSRWSSLVAMKFGHLAADRIMQGRDAATAVNEQISATARDLSDQGVPEKIVSEFADQYRTIRPTLMKNALEMVTLLAQPKGRLSKGRPQA